MHKSVGSVIAICALALAGCESMGTAAQSKTTQGAVLGGLLGAGTGAILGNQEGHHAGAGTAIGAGIGALGGAMMGHALEEQDKKNQQQQMPPATSTSTSSAPATTGQKFRPVGGEVYPDNVKYCPNHGVELRYKE